jgi:DNA-directed RNA polymerase subunit beta'
VFPPASGYLLDLAPKDLEKVIYFAAYMITWVDEDSRHRDLPTLQNQIDMERKQIEQPPRCGRRPPRQEAGGGPQAALEAEGAHRRRRRRSCETQAEKEMGNLRKSADRELDRLEKVWDRFKSLKVSDLEGDDESLYRDMVAPLRSLLRRFDGCARRSSSVCRDFDLEVRSPRCCASSSSHRQGPAQDPRPQAAQGRQRRS